YGSSGTLPFPSPPGVQIAGLLDLTPPRHLLQIPLTTVREIWKGGAMSRIVAYYRVSTESQGRSGLGLDAQRQAVTTLCSSRSWQIIAEFTEVESGKRNDRRELT